MAFRDEAMGGTSEPGARSPDPLEGTVINGKFHVVRAIARGGMGRIYYGMQAPLDRPVALKIVKADSVDEEESQFLKRFLLEASILAKLQHPNVVTLFDYGRIEGAPVEMYFIAMEYLNGVTLSERLRDQGALAAYEALVLFRQIARGLREAHSRGIVHRDLKPSNIMIVPEADGEIVKLVDFGIGKIERSGDDLTRDGVVVGTPKYMAPEQFDGQSSPASDVYALGTIVYQLLAGSLPFVGNTMAEVMVAKLAHDIRPIREVNPICDTPESLERLVLKMLARRPDERASLEEVFAMLAMCEEEVFGTAGARLATTGSGPAMGSSRPNLGFPTHSSVSAIQAYTLITPGGLTPRPSSRPSGIPMLTGMTPRPMSTSAYPLPSPKTAGMPAALIVALVIALTAVGAIGLWFAKGRLGGQATASSAAAAPSASHTSNVARTDTAPAPFVLHIASTPVGAAVSENSVVLGVTPLDLQIEPGTVADHSRTFEVRKEGFASATLTQGPSDGRVDKTVSLAPDTAHTVKSPKPQAPLGGKAPVTGGKTPPSTQPDDIRLRR